MARSIWSLVVVLMFCWLSGLAAQANVLYQDDFSEADLCWETLTGELTRAEIENGKLVMTAKQDGGLMCLNLGNNFKDADFSCDITPVQLCSSIANVGTVMFWAKDYNNCYELLLAGPGSFRIERQNHGKTNETIIPWRDNAAINAAVGKTNHVRILMKGNRASFFVNGKSLGAINGFPPAGGSKIGFSIYAPNKCATRSVVQYDNVKVSDVPVAAAPK